MYGNLDTHNVLGKLIQEFMDRKASTVKQNLVSKGEIQSQLDLRVTYKTTTGFFSPRVSPMACPSCPVSILFSFISLKKGPQHEYQPCRMYGSILLPARPTVALGILSTKGATPKGSNCFDPMYAVIKSGPCQGMESRVASSRDVCSGDHILVPVSLAGSPYSASDLRASSLLHVISMNLPWR